MKADICSVGRKLRPEKGAKGNRGELTHRNGNSLLHALNTKQCFEEDESASNDLRIREVVGLEVPTIEPVYEPRSSRHREIGLNATGHQKERGLSE